ncbi:MAG: CIA30 family protein [Acidobacteriota bacterium]
MGKIKKKLKYFFLLIIFFILLIVYPLFFHKKETNNNILPEEYIKGVFHVHSNFSDGKGDINEITRAAQRQKLDFVILTDHGEPNLKCAGSTSFMNNVLLIGGSEFSLDCGHLACAGFNIEDYRFPNEPQEAINDVNSYNGFSFISHPLDNKIPWTDWDVNSFTGLEVLSSYSSARRIGVTGLFSFIIRYMINKEFALINTLHYPEDNLKIWDSFNKKGKYSGIYALDAHAQIPVTKKINLNFPSYESMFGILNVYVKIENPLENNPHISSKIIIQNIKKGNFFNVIEGIASANGFDNYYVTSSGEKLDMGSSSENVNGHIIFELPFEFPVDIIIKKDGKNIYKVKNYFKNKFEFKVNKSGTYRSEIFLSKGRFRKLPWIITNPFFLNDSAETKIEKKSGLKEISIFDNKKAFNIEMNPASAGTIEYNITDNKSPFFLMKYHLKKEENKKNFWVSLSNRETRDLSDYKGISFQASSAKRMRYWVEFRTLSDKKEKWYRHSFLADKNWRKINIPFNKFSLIHGPEDGSNPDLSRIRAIFFSVNNSVSNLNEIRGELSLKAISVFSYFHEK